MFSKTCEYAIRALVLIAKNSLAGGVVSQREITEKLQSPDAFTAKIVQQLSKHKFVKSIKGPTGGYFIEEVDMQKIKMLDIVRIFDGEDLTNRCVLGLTNCSNENPCAFHHKFLPIREKLNKELMHCSLHQLVIDNQNMK